MTQCLQTWPTPSKEKTFIGWGECEQEQASKTFKIAWEPEFPRKIAFHHFEVKPTPITLINLVLRRKGPLKKQNTLFWPINQTFLI